MGARKKAMPSGTHWQAGQRVQWLLLCLVPVRIEAITILYPFSFGFFLGSVKTVFGMSEA